MFAQMNIGREEEGGKITQKPAKVGEELANKNNHGMAININNNQAQAIKPL